MNMRPTRHFPSVASKMSRSQAAALVEQKTVFVTLVKLGGKAETAARGFGDILNRCDSRMLCSLTYDQGRKMGTPRYPLHTQWP